MAAQGFPTVDSWEVVVGGAQDAPGLAKGLPQLNCWVWGKGERREVLGWDWEGCDCATETAQNSTIDAIRSLEGQRGAAGGGEYKPFSTLCKI